MNNSSIFIKVHRISSDGTVTSFQIEEDFDTHKLVSVTPISDGDFSYSSDLDENYEHDEDRVNLVFPYTNPNDNSVTLVNTGDVVDLNSLNYSEDVNVLLKDSKAASSEDVEIPNLQPRYKSKIPIIPTKHRCLNCNQSFAVKYHYERHICEYIGEKVMKAVIPVFEKIEEGVKYDCPTCGKQFLRQHNLNRHQSTHEATHSCEHCQKKFTTENRLRIHKENYCKKINDGNIKSWKITTVWKCVQCYQVFATSALGNKHSGLCTKISSKNVDLNTPIEFINVPEETCGLQLNQEENKNVFCILSKSPKQDNDLMETDDVNQIENANGNVKKLQTELLLHCEYCNTTYSEKSSLVNHQVQHTTQINYECVACKETFNSYKTARNHWVEVCPNQAGIFHLPKMTYCEICDKTFKSHETLYRHKTATGHYTQKLHGVDISDVDYLKSEDYKNVMSIKDEFAPQSSNQENCPRIISPQKKGKRGRKRRLPLEPLPSTSSANDFGIYKYQCHLCILAFDNIEEMEEHRKKKHTLCYPCEVCGQGYSSSRALIHHNKTHKDSKPNVCKKCGKSFTQTSHLQQHMRFHLGIKPFACPNEGCEARFTIRPDLKDHIRKVHTRERPYKCTECDKCFLTGSVYYQHRRIHSEDRRFNCDICEKRFYRRDCMNIHRRIHTNEKPYSCQFCEKAFRQNVDRNKHVRSRHAALLSIT